MVGAVGELASMKRHKLWKTGEDGLCCSSSAIQTRLGPSRETAKVYRYESRCWGVLSPLKLATYLDMISNNQRIICDYA